jgi:hypothetical protein
MCKLLWLSSYGKALLLWRYEKMKSENKWQKILVYVILVAMIAVTACSSSTSALPAATATHEATQPLSPTDTPAPSNTPVPSNTPTPAPSSTPQPSETPQPSATPQLAIAKDGISAWCLPENVLISAASDPLTPPAAARLSTFEKDALEIRNMPFSICLFMYNFNQSAPSGLKLEIYDMGQKKPWWTTDLGPVDGKPSMVYTPLRHTYIVNPPLWNVSYIFVVRDANGNEVQRNQVNLHRWTTGLCWQGNYPDPVTLYCPLQQDLHPWDVGYGTVLPTVTPRK